MPELYWQLTDTRLRLDPGPLVMGIVNVTPDSFSDGGQFADPARAVAHGLQLVADGADLLDVGGESTRPGSTPVDADEQRRRVIPVISDLAEQTSVPISVDTSSAEVARRALEAGARIINDVTGLAGDPAMVDVAREFDAGVCAMHMQGTPQTMQDNPQYDHVVEDVFGWLVDRRDWLVERGIELPRICLDPGIGFGKTHQHNLQLLAGIARFQETGCPILVGHSRKGFIRTASGDDAPEQLAGTLTVSLYLARAGVQILRVHDVRATRQALLMQAALDAATGAIE